MGRFDITRAKIDANIRSNGTQAITGRVLNSVMNEIVNDADKELDDIENEISEFKEAVVEQVESYKPVVINGDVVNAADEEDLTSENNLLRFKNRSPINGMGYIILRKDKTFEEQVSQSKTIYEIRYDFNLTAEFTMPEDCVLKFVGGHIRGAKLIFNDTFIIAGCSMGILPSQIGGRISNPEVYPEWLSNSYEEDYTPLIQCLIDSASEKGVSIVFTGREYLISPTITLKSNVALYSNVASKFIIAEDALYASVLYSAEKLENVTIRGLVFEQIPEKYDVLAAGEVSRLIITLYNESLNVIVENCHFYFNGTNAIAVNGELSNNTIIRNNMLVFKRAHIANDREYDVSAIYITDHYHRIEGNRITSIGGDFNKMGGGIETHGVAGIVTDNVFDNCKVCINVVNDIVPSETDEIGRIISSNTASNCNNFICLWAVSTYPSLKNIKISDNVATGIKLSAIRSTIDRNTNVDGDLENIIVSNNFFEGLYNVYDGQEYSPYVQDVFNMATILIDSPGAVSNFIVERNVIKSFPCNILLMSQYSREGEPTQSVVFKDNTILDCFNSDRSFYYPAYYCFALFAAGRNAEIEILDNIIRIPNDISLPPTLTWLHDGANVKFYRNIFPEVSSKMTYNTNSNFESDLLDVRKPKLIYEDEEDVFVTGDIIYSLGNKAYCTFGGMKSDIVLTETYAELENGVGYYSVANADNLKVDYRFSTQVGTTPLVETIKAIVGTKIYTNSWASLRAYFGEATKLNVVFSFQKAAFGLNSVDVSATPQVVPDERGMMYFSLGTSKPSWLDKSGNWKDAFGREVAAYQGTLAERPISASFAHLYMLTDSGERRPIWKNSSGGDQWISADGYNGLLKRKGTTSERPSAYEAGEGFTYYDSTLGKMILSNGSYWTNVDGTSL